MRFDTIAQFQNDIKRLSRKYRSLPEDFEEFKKVVSAIPCGNSKHFAVLLHKGDIRIIKARLFCRYLRGSSLRVIYAYHEPRDYIDFIELYFKGDKETEDSQRIREYMNDQTS